MTEAVDFEARLTRLDGTGPRTALPLPFDAKALFGRARGPVRVTINGYSWRTTTQVEGGSYLVVVNAAARQAAGIAVDDTVLVHIKKDDSVPAIDVPSELASALRADLAARDAFEALGPSHRREYARWVADAKRPETRVRRSVAAAERLKAASRRPLSA